MSPASNGLSAKGLTAATSASQAVNYIASHDVEQYRRERLFTMLRNFSEPEKRIKLAFACLLTAGAKSRKSGLFRRNTLDASRSSLGRRKFTPWRAPPIRNLTHWQAHQPDRYWSILCH